MEYLILLQILITEIHPTPAAGEPEWVECAIQTTGPVRLDTLQVCDNRSCARLPNVKVEKGACIILTRDEQALRETRPVPKGVVIVECALPSLNNTSDRIELRRIDSSITDSVAYSIRAEERGRSIERHGMIDNGMIAYSSQWSATTAYDSATCGKINSHVQYEHDVGITGMFINDSVLNIGVVNAGRTRAEGQLVRITVGSYSTERHCPPLIAKAWWSTRVHLRDIAPTEVLRIDTVCVILTTTDMRMENNRYVTTVTIPPMAGGITITEILAEPSEGDCDFVELWNGTADTVELSDWTIDDGSGQVCRIIGPQRLAPHTFLACASDTAIARMSAGTRWALVRPSLNVHAVSDSLTLRTSSGFVADVAVYDKKHHNSLLLTTKGRSLEKRVENARNIGSTAWGTSTANVGSTPGAPNTLAVDHSTGTAILSAHPSPFSTYEGAERFPCILSWSQPFEQAFGRLVVVGLDGSAIAELLNGEFIGTRGSVAWDGRNTTTRASAAVGIYVAAFECIDANTNQVIRGTCPVVIGESR
jgi:hypothetical protein